MEASTTSSTINFANYPLRDIPAPHPHDVLCGRGGGTNNHVGNSHWRMLVAANKQLYVTLPKRQKMLLSRSIVNAVRSQNPPGRFLQKDTKSDLWYDVGDQRAQEKTSQALREGAPNIRGKKLDGDTPSTGECTEANTKKKPDTTKPSPTPNLPNPPPVSEKNAAHSTNMMHQGPNGPFNAPNAAAPSVPPGSTPVMVYAMPQGGVPAMYPAMVTPDGMMVPTMQGGAPPPPLPPPIPSQLPGGKNGQSVEKVFSLHNNSMPPPSNLTDPSTTSSLAEIGAQSSETISYSNRAQCHSDSQVPLHGNGPLYDKEIEETVDMVGGGLEPTGISFGSISMNSVSGKLEPAGTSFGSMMSYTVGSKAPEPIDGGLEPIGTSFGSLSLNSAEQSNLQRALNSDGQDSRRAKEFDAIPTLLSQQKSMGNLLECSDTESDEPEEDKALKQASKSAEWEKLKSILEAHTNMENIQASQPPAPYRSQNAPCEAIPHTGFDRDFSNVSAMSMGEFEDFDNLAPLNQKNEPSHEYDSNNVASEMAPPPPLPIHKEDDDDDSISSREKLQLMYLTQGGAGTDYSGT